MEENVTGFGTKLELDISTTITPDFQKLCFVSNDLDIGEEMDTWFTTCSKFASNEKTAIDPTWSFTAKTDKSNPAVQMIMDCRFKVGADVKKKARWTDVVTDIAYEFLALISNVSVSYETPTVIEFSFDLKIASGEITETPVV